MLKLLKLAIVLWLPLVLVSRLLISLSQQVPSPANITALHLDQCELPCWIGIIPGQTTLREAKALINKRFPGANYPVIEPALRLRVIDKTSGLSFDITLNLVASVDQIFKMTETQLDQIVVSDVEISFLAGNSSPNTGDLYAMIGPPTDIVWYATQGVIRPSLRYYNHEIAISSNIPIDKNGCSRQSWTAPIISLEFHPRLPLRTDWLYKPQIWAGFRSCYYLTE